MERTQCLSKFCCILVFPLAAFYYSVAGCQAVIGNIFHQHLNIRKHAVKWAGRAGARWTGEGTGTPAVVQGSAPCCSHTLQLHRSSRTRPKAWFIASQCIQSSSHVPNISKEPKIREWMNWFSCLSLSGGRERKRLGLTCTSWEFALFYFMLANSSVDVYWYGFCESVFLKTALDHL